MKQKKDLGPVDPFSDSDFSLPEDPATPQAAASAKRGSRKKKNKSNRDSVVRISDIEETLRTQADDIDPETVISYYVPRRRARLFGLALLRLDKLYLFLIIVAVRQGLDDSLTIKFLVMKFPVSDQII